MPECNTVDWLYQNNASIIYGKKISSKENNPMKIDLKQKCSCSPHQKGKKMASCFFFSLYKKISARFTKNKAGMCDSKTPVSHSLKGQMEQKDVASFMRECI